MKNLSFKELAALQEGCKHERTYYSVEGDNFYCQRCHGGMGQEYYESHITDTVRIRRGLAKAHIEDCDGDDL